MENLLWACDKTHPLFLFVFNSRALQSPPGSGEEVKRLRKELKYYMGVLVVGQLQALCSGKSKSGVSGRWREIVRVDGAPEAGTAVTSVTSTVSPSGPEEGPQSDCQSARGL